MWLGLLVVMLVLALPAGARADAIDDGAPYCEDFVPEAAAAPVGGAPIDIHLLVLLDGVSLQRGQELVAAAGAAYAPVGLRLVAQFRTVDFSGRLDTAIMGQAKRMLGGRRPDTAHAVYVLTSEDIVAQTATGENEGVAGTAMCIGGIAMPDMAFAIGEDRQTFGTTDGPKVAAHELGHLLGAHHHYGNCAEGLSNPSALEPCTIMSSMAPRFLALHFGALSSTIVRGYAEKFVLPLPAPPPPPEPTPPAEPANPAEPAGQASGPAAVRLAVVGRVRRRGSGLAVRVRSDGAVRRLTARLRRRGRTVATGRLDALDGEGTIRLRARKRVRAGRYVLLLTGTAAGGAVSLRQAVTVSR